MSPDQKQAGDKWKEGAKDAFDTAEKLFGSKKYHHALFFCHLATEKALKATYILEHNEMPPYTHHVVFLASRVSANLSKEQLEYLKEINTFNIAARYQEDKLELYKKATQEYAKVWMDHVSSILKVLL